MSEEILQELSKFRVSEGQQIKLDHFPTEYVGKSLGKKEGESLLEESREKLSEFQDKLYAHNRYGVLIILQAMDASGKDGAVKHILSGVNPLGVKITSYKAPTSHELDHDYLWRHMMALPARGEIAIHNRSHYENVLVTRIHPQYILKENIPGIDSVDKINNEFWQDRFRQINRFEENIAANGTIILKFFLHLSKKEQKKRLISRIDDATKDWKFELGDLKERGHWDEYQKAYEQAINATSKEYAPWFIVPADDKWYTRFAIATLICKELDRLDLHYPKVSSEQRAALLAAKEQLLNED